MTPLDSPSPSRSLLTWFYSLLAAAPFLVFPLIHFVRWGNEATGFTTYDLPYYAANARAILDRGHAGFYPNPFDPDPAAPVIYFHWLMAALAALIGPLGIKPGHALLLIQMIGALASARLMYALVAWLLPTSRWRTLLYFLTMWSGGLLVPGKLAANLANGLRWSTDLLALDPGHGLWCLNFGRNLILPTEAIYHALMLALWLSILKARWNHASLSLLAIAATHPFTGAQALAIVGAHAVGCYLMPSGSSAHRRRRTGSAAAGQQASPETSSTHETTSRYFVRKVTQPVSAHTIGPPPPGFLVSCTLIAIAFVAYYFVFLPRFPQHREIQHTWTLGWTLPGPTILLAYTPAALLAWLAIRSDSAWRRQSRFLLVAAGVSFLLANHQWFITPRQPIHFTRGYIWTPLFLVGLPALARLFDRLFGPDAHRPTVPTAQSGEVSREQHQALPRPFAVPMIALLTAVAIADNTAFLVINATSPNPPGFHLTHEEQAAFDAIRLNHVTGVLLTDDDRVGYLAAALTSARPWLGHKYNTPQFEARQRKLAAFKSTTAAGDLLEEVEVALTADPRIIRRLQDEGWQRRSTHGRLQLWQR